jgi:hypothetical protein
MPAYVFNRESFLRFLEGQFDEDTVVIVSSDTTELKKERVESYVGEKDYFLVEFGVPADIVELNEEEFDELVKYTIIFVERDELSDAGKKALR